MKSIFYVTLCAIFILCAPTHTAAAKRKEKPKSLPQISFPLDCTLGQDCWIAHHIDTDPGETVNDFTCGKKTYNNHMGTDIAIKDMSAMNAGVNVKPVLAGKIFRARDTLTDTIKSNDDLKVLSAGNKACGNGILIDHAPAGYPGLRSVYCHLKQDSITVKKNDIVTPNDTIAQVGHSGDTKFPHLHFSLVWEGRTIDPFIGQNINANENACAAKYKEDSGEIWNNKIQYENITIFASGFTNEKPNFEHIINDASTYEKINPSTKTLAFWAGFFGLQKDDVIDLKIFTPNKKIFAQRVITHSKFEPRQYYFLGRKKQMSLRSGSYTAHIKVIRHGNEIMSHKKEIYLK